MLDLETALLVVTPTTITGAIVVGIVLALVFYPAFGLAIGANKKREPWGVFVGTETIGVTFFTMIMIGRFYDGSSTAIAWVGNILLWTLTSFVAAATLWLVARLRGEEQ